MGAFLLLAQQSLVPCTGVLCALPRANATADYAGYTLPAWIFVVTMLAGAQSCVVGVFMLTAYSAKFRAMPETNAWPLVSACLLANLLRLAAVGVAQLALLTSSAYVSSAGIAPFSYGLVAMPLGFALFEALIARAAGALARFRDFIQTKAYELKRGRIANALDDDETELGDLRRPAQRPDARPRVTGRALAWARWLALVLMTLVVSVLVRAVDAVRPATYVAIAISLVAALLWTSGDAMLAHATGAPPQQSAWLRVGTAGTACLLNGITLAMASAAVLVVVYVPAMDGRLFAGSPDTTIVLALLLGTALALQVVCYKFARGIHWLLATLGAAWLMLAVSGGVPSWAQVASLAACGVATALIGLLRVLEHGTQGDYTTLDDDQPSTVSQFSSSGDGATMRTRETSFDSGL
jgi:hypothetical protein